MTKKAEAQEVQLAGQWAVDENGEVVGHATIGYLIQSLKTGQLKELTRHDVTKIAQAMHTADLEIQMLEGYKETVAKNVEPRILALESRKHAVLQMFGRLLAQAVEAEPDEQGGKTATTPFGKVSVRLYKGQLSVADEAKAIEHAQTYEPGLVSMKPVLDKRAFTAKMKDWPDLDDVGIKRGDDYEATTIDTGAGKTTVKRTPGAAK